MSNSEKFESVQVVPKETIIVYGKELVQQIADRITRELSTKILDRAKFSDVIISLKPLRVTERKAWCEVEYSRSMTVTELIRCKECKFHHNSLLCSMYSEGMDTPEDWFCADGKRKDDV